jgi:hypothetical protein
MINPIAKKRLSRLAKFLTMAPPENFDMERWRSDAIGHACTIPEFQDAGLHLFLTPYLPNLVPRYGRVCGWDAVSQFFSLSRDEAYQLFAAPYYEENQRTPLGVSARIHTFVASQ